MGRNELALAGFDVDLSLAPVPEPSSWALLSGGGLALLCLHRRRLGGRNRALAV